MKLQYLAIIFVMIFIPVFLVTSFYIQKQSATISKQLEYDSNLLDATHDAMAAFEINTANEDLSTVSDSLRSIIDASNNILLNTLAINFGISNASKSYVQPYIPAVLYSLYDGYYIYSPTRVPSVCTDKFGQTITTDSYGVKYETTITVNGKQIGIYKFDANGVTYGADGVTATGGSLVNYNTLPSAIKEEYGQMLYKNQDGTYSTVVHSTGGNRATEYKISYILKSYIPYSVNYSRANRFDIDINYTLDNFITIMGTIDDVYYTKSGYIIDKNLIKEVKVNGNKINWYTYSYDELGTMAKDSAHNIIEIVFNPDENGNEIIITNQDNSYSVSGTAVYWSDAQDAVSYYAKAWAFSEWVYEKLGDLKEADVVDNIYEEVNSNIDVAYVNNDGVNEKLLYEFDASIIDNIFDTNTNPEDSESNFEIHRRNVIRNSITYNLSVAMTTYNEKYSGMTFSMPVLTEEEWDKILTNVSVLTFMQGLKCGLKVYNNYALVSSTNNELSVIPEEIYYTKYEMLMSFTDTNYETAHRLNCLELEDSEYYASFKSKEVKYDKVYNTITGVYDYDHRVYTCYNCLVNPNYNYYAGDASGKNQKRNVTGLLLESIKEMVTKNSNYINRQKAYYIAVAKERENLYKPTEVSESNGIMYLCENNPTLISNGNVVSISSFDSPSNIPEIKLKNIEKIDLTISDTEVSAINTFTTNVRFSANGLYNFSSVIIPTTSKVTRTLEFKPEYSANSVGEYGLNSLKFSIGSSAVKFKINSLKIYYK